ncbi:MAG: hypothetical protein M3Y48_19215 [Actinomycetota bacterium]|nr:hypothetical protein [Actinomycetota bacterium]
MGTRDSRPSSVFVPTRTSISAPAPATMRFPRWRDAELLREILASLLRGLGRGHLMRGPAFHDASPETTPWHGAW